MDNIAFITGATGTLAPYLRQELEVQGYTVIQGRRQRPGDAADADGWVLYNNKTLIDSAFWKEKINGHATENTKKILLINTIGQPRAPEGSTLEEVNVKPVVALATAGKEIAEVRPHTQITIVHISAIAAEYLHDAYGMSRRAADEQAVAIGQSGPINFTAVALRLPFVFPNPVEQQDGSCEIKGLQPWSMEQIAQLPIIPLPGSGEQKLRPVSVQDVALAVANTINLRRSAIISAMGSQEVTARELIELYAKLSGKGKPMMISNLPAGLLAPVLSTFPYGLLDGYATRVMCAMEKVDYDPKEFTELLQREPQGIKTVHQGLEGKKIQLAKPPVIEHLSEHKGKLLTVGLVASAITALGIKKLTS